MLLWAVLRGIGITELQRTGFLAHPLPYRADPGELDVTVSDATPLLALALRSALLTLLVLVFAFLRG